MIFYLIANLINPNPLTEVIQIDNACDLKKEIQKQKLDRNPEALGLQCCHLICPVHWTTNSGPGPAHWNI